MTTGLVPRGATIDLDTSGAAGEVVSAVLARLPAAAALEATSRLHAAAARREIGSTRLALAWLLARFPGAYVAPSTRRAEHFEMDLAAERVEPDEQDVHATQGHRQDDPFGVVVHRPIR